MDTFTGTVGVGYHHQAQSAHQKADIATGDNHRAPDTPTTDGMTEGAAAGPMYMSCMAKAASFPCELT